MDFKAAFEKEAHGIVRDPTTKEIVAGPAISKTSKSLCQADYDFRLYVLLHYETGDMANGIPLKLFKQRYRSAKSNFKNLQVEESATGGKTLYHYTPDKD